MLKYKKNLIFTIISFVLTTLISFLTRNIFVNSLTRELVGLTGVYSNATSVITVLEFGIGATLTYCLYKPLRDKNYGKALMYIKIHKKLYYLVFLVETIVGILTFSPLSLTIKSTLSFDQLFLIYVCYLATTTLGYFFVSNKLLALANEDFYKIAILTIFNSISSLIVPTFVLYKTKNITTYLLVQVAVLVVGNLIVNIYIKHLYKDIFKVKPIPLTEDERSNLKKLLKGNGLSTIGVVMLNGFDNIILSNFVGLGIVAIYSNYQLITVKVKSIVTMLQDALQSTFAKFILNNNKKEYFNKYKKLSFGVYLLTSLLGLGFITCMNPFIKIWLGTHYLLNNNTVLILGIYLILTSYRSVNGLILNVCGQFWAKRYVTILEAVVDIVLALIFVGVFNLGILGVILGNLISTLILGYGYEQYLVMKTCFYNSLSSYKFVLKYLIVIIVDLLVIKVITNFIVLKNGLILLALYIVITIIIWVISNILVFKDDLVNLIKNVRV